MSPWAVLWSVARHHSEPADPDLLEWIKGFLDHLFHLGPWTIVTVLALLILLMPIAIITVYLVQQRRRSGATATRPKRKDV